MAFNSQLLNFYQTDSNANFNIAYASLFYIIIAKPISYPTFTKKLSEWTWQNSSDSPPTPPQDDCYLSPSTLINRQISFVGSALCAEATKPTLHCLAPHIGQIHFTLERKDIQKTEPVLVWQLLYASDHPLLDFERNSPGHKETFLSLFWGCFRVWL